MKLFVSLLFVVLLSAPRVFAGSETYADERIQVTSTTAVGLTSSLLAQPTNSASPCAALITAEGQNVRFRLSGSLATNTTGHLLVAGNAFTVDSWQDMRNFSAIGEVATSTITVSYQRGCAAQR